MTRAIRLVICNLISFQQKKKKTEYRNNSGQRKKADGRVFEILLEKKKRSFHANSLFSVNLSYFITNIYIKICCRRTETRAIQKVHLLLLI